MHRISEMRCTETVGTTAIREPCAFANTVLFFCGTKWMLLRIGQDNLAVLVSLWPKHCGKRLGIAADNHHRLARCYRLSSLPIMHENNLSRNIPRNSPLATLTTSMSATRNIETSLGQHATIPVTHAICLPSVVSRVYANDLSDEFVCMTMPLLSWVQYCMIPVESRICLSDNLSVFIGSCSRFESLIRVQLDKRNPYMKKVLKRLVSLSQSAISNHDDKSLSWIAINGVLFGWRLVS
jgi:hypothetical protein